MFVGYLVEVCLTCCQSYRLPFIFITIYGVVCVQLAHFSSRWLKGYIYSSCYNHHQIGSIHLSHCYHILPWLCVWVTPYSVFYCIYVPGKPGICFHCYSAVYDECKYSDIFWLADRTSLFVQYTISLSSLRKFIWRHWTYIKCLSDIFCRVSE